MRIHISAAASLLLLVGCASAASPRSAATVQEIRPDSVYNIRSVSRKPKLVNSEMLVQILESQLSQSSVPNGARTTYSFVITTSGETKDVEVFRSSGYRQLDAAGLSAIREARFSPGTINGTPVNVYLEIPLTFRKH